MANRSRFFSIRKFLLVFIAISFFKFMQSKDSKNDETTFLTRPSSTSSSSSSNSTVSTTKMTTSKRETSNHYITNVSFRQELIDERLKTHVKMYEEKNVKCTSERPFQVDEKENYDEIEKTLKKIQSEMISYPENYFSGRGIVLTMGDAQLPFIKVNLQMIEFTSTRLPVQIWFSSSQVSKDDAKKLFDIAPNINISLCNFDENQCEFRTGIFKLNSSNVYQRRSDSPFKSFPYKPAAIISSTFVEVLFLDCDAYLTRDPDELFLSDPMYEQFGAILYPDSYKTRQHPYIWKLLNSSCGEDEYEIDSATILVNKAKVWKGLYATKLMNDYHDIFYAFASGGDKDTFRLGFRLMQVKYYLAMTPCATGKFDGKRFCGFTLCKTDSLAQHVYVNHVHMFKHDKLQYTQENLAYTRIGLADPNNHPFLVQQCRLPGISWSCFHIIKLPNNEMSKDNCFIGEIPNEDHEDHLYLHNETLLYDGSRKNKILLTKTNNLMPSFVEHALKLLT